MMNSKRILAMVLALVMVFSMLPMSAGAEEVPAFSITSATGKAGEEVTVAVTIENNPGVMMYNYGIQYDTTRLELLEKTKAGMDDVGIWTVNDKVLWENNDFVNNNYNGEALTVKFKIKEDAPAGDAEISIYDFMALDYEGNLVEYALKSGKITVAEKLETLIPFTKANHTDSGAAIHDKYTGVLGLKVEGIKITNWTEWKQGGNYQNQSITIFVDPASKDDAVTLSLSLAEGQAGSGPLIDNPATYTLQLSDGAGSYTASYLVIGSGGLAPRLHIPITFKLGCTEHSFADATCNTPKTCTVCGITEGEPDSSAHSWNDATCTNAKTCSACGATDGEADPDAHSYVEGVCEYCGATQAASTYEVKVNGGVNDAFYVVTGKDDNGYDVLGDKLSSTQSDDGEYRTITVPADVTRIGYNDLSGELGWTTGFNVSPENAEVSIDYVEFSIKNPDGAACTEASVTVEDSDGYQQLAYDYDYEGMWSISAVIGEEYTITVTAPGCKTAVVEKTFTFAGGYQSFDITLEAEAQEPEEPEGYAIPITGGHLKNNIANIYVSGVEVVGTPTNALGYGHLSETITVQVSAATKDNTATIAYDVVNSEGLTGSVEAFTVALNKGVGSAEKTFTLADGKQITLTINFELAPCTEHSWNDATCTAPKTCSVCGATDGEADPDAHNYVDGVCEYCGEAEAQEPEFEGVTLEIAKQTAIDRYGTVYFSLPAGKDLKIILDTKGALQQFDDVATSTSLVHTFREDCEITVTADELAKHFLAEEWLEFLADYNINPDANNGYLYLMAFNGSKTYIIILEVVSDAEPETPAAPGYTFATSADVSAENGENVVVKVNITGHSNPEVTTYNAYDVTLTYDNEKLEYVNFDGAVKSDNGQVEVDKENGTIRIVGCGADKDFGTEIAALTFKTKGEGEANVTISKVQVSDKDTAVDDNIPEASAKHDEDDTTADATPDVSVVVVPYTVTKPTFVSGNDKVLHGESYTFSYTDTTNYTYSGLTVTVGGTAVTPTEADGVYTIESVTGTVVITANQTANSYAVTKPENVTGPAQATYGENYVFTVTPNTDMAIDTVTVKYEDGSDVPYTVNENGEYVIAGDKISGPFTITVTETNTKTTINFVGIETTEIEGGQVTVSAEIGKDFNFKLIKEAAYSYTVKVGETELNESTTTAGQYTIPANLVVAGGVTVNITKADSSKVTVDVHEYISLDGKAMFLVTAKWRDKVLAYGEETMIYSSKYTVTGYEEAGAYCWLVVSTDEMNTKDAVKAAAESAIVEAAAGTTAAAVKYNYDINGTTKVDVNDAQLTYDMYNASYMEFTENLPMLKFLEADMSTNMKLDVNDVAAVINYIVSGAAN